MAKPQYTPFDVADFSKILREFKIPDVDWQELMASQQRNLAALTKANQVLMEGAQTVMQREVEILQNAMAEVNDAARDLMQADDPQAGAAKRLELAKESFAAAVNNMRELADLATKSNREALDVINQRALEGLEEIKAVVKAKT